jgi:hypothetical protein
MGSKGANRNRVFNTNQRSRVEVSPANEKSFTSNQSEQAKCLLIFSLTHIAIVHSNISRDDE